MKLLGDFETKSNLSLPEVGAEKYLREGQADIVCLSFCFDEGPAQLWLPGMPPPVKRFSPTTKFYAHNAYFDYRVWNYLGKKYGFPRLPIENVVDIMAICGRFTYPQQLSAVGKVLKLRVQKDSKGKSLMKKICSPPFRYTDQELREFYSYCLQDTMTMRELLSALPVDELSDSEQQIWLDTVKLNSRGLPIDLPSVKRIYAVMSYFRQAKVRNLPIITDGEVQTPGQIQKIRKYCAKFGVRMSDCTAETVDNLLESDNLPAKVRNVLHLRQMFAGTAVKKYVRLLSMVRDGHIYDNLAYYAASTGRFGGRAFQIHNLPRAKVEDIEATIRAFFDSSIVTGDPMYAAKALIRSMIQAPTGYVIVVADYSSIENVLLLWAAGQWDRLEEIKSGLKQYKVFATKLFGCEYGQETDWEYMVSKATILGAGYGLGAKGFLAYCEGYGIKITPQQGEEAIGTWRADHPLVVKFWYNCKDAVVNAILYKGKEFSCHPITVKCVTDRNGRSWLKLTLPSGRSLFYADPFLKDDKYGPAPCHYGINSYTKQWTTQRLIPGRIVENIIQALARDLLCNGVSTLLADGYDIRAHVHDEILSIEPKDNPRFERMLRLMCKLPQWADGLHLTAEGEVLDRYKKI